MDGRERMGGMDKIQQQALEKVMRQLNTTANDVNRYIADAVAEHDQIAALRAENERLRTLLDKVYDIAVEDKFEEVEAAIDDARWRERQEDTRAALEGEAHA